LALNGSGSSFLLAFAPAASSGHYWVLWAWTEPAIILLEFAAVYEAVGRIGSTCPQLDRVGRFVVLACVGAAAIMAAFSIAGDIRTLDRWTSPVVIRHASFDVRRAASIGLAGVIACVLGCTLFWQSRMPRNTRLHACLLFWLASQIAVGKRCSRQLSVALSGRLRSAIILAARTIGFKSFQS
jgi:hypothetical protein